VCHSSSDLPATCFHAIHYDDAGLRRALRGEASRYMTCIARVSEAKSRCGQMLLCCSSRDRISGYWRLLLQNGACRNLCAFPFSDERDLWSRECSDSKLYEIHPVLRRATRPPEMLSHVVTCRRCLGKSGDEASNKCMSQ
jgi:hypothetical protein